jgi:hypothetical protein
MSTNLAWGLVFHPCASSLRVILQTLELRKHIYRAKKVIGGENEDEILADFGIVIRSMSDLFLQEPKSSDESTELLLSILVRKPTESIQPYM